MARDLERLLAIGERLRQLRRPIAGTDPVRYEIVQPTVAAVADISLRAYQAWEGGEAEPDWENLKRVAEWHGVDPNWIMQGDTEPSHLDRVEAKLDLLLEVAAVSLSRRAPEGPAEVLEAEAERIDELLARIAASLKHSPNSGSSS
jgi:transcriptional regulator with XRE-family HTH domain